MAVTTSDSWIAGGRLEVVQRHKRCKLRLRRFVKPTSR